MSPKHGLVQRRQVLFIPGFDPHPPRRYRELYRREGAEQARIAGHQLAVRSKSGGTWSVIAEIDGHGTFSEIEVLVWSDLVRDTMAPGWAASYLKLIGVVWTYMSTGVLWRLAAIGTGPLIAALYPVVGLILQLVLAGLLGWGTAQLMDLIALGWGWIPGIVAAVLVMRALRRADGRFFVHYLMADFAYWASADGAYPAALEERISDFAAHIKQALSGKPDELLVVGHSSGAALAVSALAEHLGIQRAELGGVKLSLLTLGQSIPMQSFLPKADRLRRDLNQLSRDPRVTWVDVSAPGDGCSFALTDPVSVSGVAPDAGKRWPLVLSAAFSKTLSPERRRRIRHRYFRLHFQYLCAFDDPRPYDYFRITAGPDTLAGFFSHRAPSANRIEWAASGHISMVV